jgi:cytochrome c2
VSAPHVLVAIAAIAFAVVGCAPAASAPAAAPSADATAPAMAELHTRKCGACHTVPEPRTRSRPHLEDALARHRKRVRLTEEQWHAMIEYLAASRE